MSNLTPFRFLAEKKPKHTLVIPVGDDTKHLFEVDNNIVTTLPSRIAVTSITLVTTKTDVASTLIIGDNTFTLDNTTTGIKQVTNSIFGLRFSTDVMINMTAAPTGKFKILIEYTEYTKQTGEFTEIKPLPVLLPELLFTVSSAGRTFTVTDTTNYGGKAPTSVSWDFGDGNTATGSSANNVYTVAGTYLITMTVTFADGQTITAQRPAVVVNNAPVASFTYSVIDVETNTYRFTSTATDDLAIASYNWDFGDGNTATGAVVEHTYAVYDELNVTLTAVDAEGLSDTATDIIDTHIDLPYLAHFPTHDYTRLRVATNDEQFNFQSPWQSANDSVNIAVSLPADYDNQVIQAASYSRDFRYSQFYTGYYTYDDFEQGSSIHEGNLGIPPYDDTYIANSALRASRFDSQDGVIAMKFRYGAIGSPNLNQFQSGFGVTVTSTASTPTVFRFEYDRQDGVYRIQGSAVSGIETIAADVPPTDENGLTYLFVEFTPDSPVKVKVGVPDNWLEIAFTQTVPFNKNLQYAPHFFNNNYFMKHMIKFGDKLTSANESMLIDRMSTDTTSQQVLQFLGLTSFKAHYDFTDTNTLNTEIDGSGVTPVLGDVIRRAENQAGSEFNISAVNASYALTLVQNDAGQLGARGLKGSYRSFNIEQFDTLGQDTHPDKIMSFSEAYPLGMTLGMSVSLSDGPLLQDNELYRYDSIAPFFYYYTGSVNTNDLASVKRLNDNKFEVRFRSTVRAILTYADYPVLSQTSYDKVLLFIRPGETIAAYINGLFIQTDIAVPVLSDGRAWTSTLPFYDAGKTNNALTHKVSILGTGYPDETQLNQLIAELEV